MEIPNEHLRNFSVQKTRSTVHEYFSSIKIERFYVSHIFSELFTDGDSVMSSGAGAKFGGIMGRARPKQDPPVEKELWLSLDEVYSGCTKKLKISRRVQCIDQLISSSFNYRLHFRF